MTTPQSVWQDKLGRLSIRCVQILAVLVVAIAIVYAAISLKLVVIPVIIALILACAVRPMVLWMERRGLPDALAAAIALLTGLVLFGGAITLVVFGVQSQWPTLVKATSEGVDRLQSFVEEGGLPIDTAQIDSFRQSAVDFLTSSQFGSGAIAGVSAAAEVVTGAVLGLVVFFYFVKDGPRIWAFLIRPFRGRGRKRAVRVGHEGAKVLGGYIRGTATVALVDTVFIGAGLVFLGVPLALPLALVVFIGAFVPIVGATVAGILAALVALVTNDLGTALWVVGIVILVNQLEGNLLQPVVLGNALKLHGLVVLLALTAGTILGGIVGAILSVPLTAVAWTAWKIVMEPDEEEKEPSPPAHPHAPPAKRGVRGLTSLLTGRASTPATATRADR
ncbi:AI-2E family transporter [Clavibacter zhangzhiyongii]|uniref:AI-2E family transporter n=1 Tax=Clavibacter zhangzhiyongii TaxID=2768071 RepID=UPI0039DF594B